MGYSPCGPKELDTTERLTTHIRMYFLHFIIQNMNFLDDISNNYMIINSTLWERRKLTVNYKFNITTLSE